MTNGQSAANIHSILDFAVSQALLSGKTGRSSISVPLEDLLNTGEGLRINEEGGGIVLKVEIKTSFDTGTEAIETEFEEDEDEDPLI